MSFSVFKDRVTGHGSSTSQEGGIRARMLSALPTVSLPVHLKTPSDHVAWMNMQEW